MVIYQNSIGCALVIHWNRKSGLDGTGLGCTFNGTDFPSSCSELTPMDVHELRIVVWVSSSLQMSLSALLSGSLWYGVQCKQWSYLLQVVTSLCQLSQGPTFGIKGGAAGGGYSHSRGWIQLTLDRRYSCYYSYKQSSCSGYWYTDSRPYWYTGYWVLRICIQLTLASTDGYAQDFFKEQQRDILVLFGKGDNSILEET